MAKKLDTNDLASVSGGGTYTATEKCTLAFDGCNEITIAEGHILTEIATENLNGQNFKVKRCLACNECFWESPEFSDDYNEYGMIIPANIKYYNSREAAMNHTP